MEIDKLNLETLEKFLNASRSRLSVYVSEALEAFTTSRDLHPFALLYATATLQNFNAFTPLPKSDQVLSVKNFRGHRKLSDCEKVIRKLYCTIRSNTQLIILY